jgi:hypothetical protein
VKDRGLAANARLVGCSASVGVRAALHERPGRFHIAVFRGHVQQRGALERKTPIPGRAEIELGKLLPCQCRVGVEMPRQVIESAAEQVDHRRYVIAGDGAGA